MKTPGALTVGSVIHQISLLDVGQVIWIETTLERYAQTQRAWAMPKSRRPAHMQDWVISTHLFTAVSAGKAGDIHYLIRVGRLA